MFMVIPASAAAFVFAFIVGAVIIDMARQVAHSGLAAEKVDPEEPLTQQPAISTA